MRALFANILSLLLWFGFFFSKRFGDIVAENETITDGDSGESKPQRADSPAIIEHNAVETSQLQNTEINASDELPKDVRVNITARDVVQPSSAVEPSVEKLLTTSKPSASRGESDFGPPSCNCPGIYIFFSSCILIQIQKVLFTSSRREYSIRD